MLKRIINIILILIFILGTSGLTVSAHYCHGELMSVSVDKPEKKCCGSSCGACKNEKVTYKIQDDYKSFNVELKHFSPEKAVLFASIITPLCSLDFSQSAYRITSVSSPPGYSSQSLPLLQIFRC